MMKKLIYSISLILFSALSIQAQVGIETEDIGESAILGFPGNINDGSYARKGILLPKIDNKNTAGTTPGTFIFDRKNKTVSYYHYNGQEGSWVEMTSPSSEEVASYTIEENQDDIGVIISNEDVEDITAEGVLILSSMDKALALPKVKDVTLLPKPKVGMICYDVASKAVAVFNGTKWSFWR